jgi:hypothetical protein
MFLSFGVAGLQQRQAKQLTAWSLSVGEGGRDPVPPPPGPGPTPPFFLVRPTPLNGRSMSTNSRSCTEKDAVKGKCQDERLLKVDNKFFFIIKIYFL